VKDFVNKTNTLIRKDLSFILAVSPLIGIFIQGILSQLTGVEFNRYLAITLLLNWGLAFQNMARLQASVGDVTRSMGSPLLIPIFLFKEAKIFDRPPVMALVWLACCFLAITTPQSKVLAIAWWTLNLKIL